MLRRNDLICAIIDTKWKRLAADPLDRKHGVSQADVYQLMAYARLYPARELMLLYPGKPGERAGERRQFGIAGGPECLRIATVDVSLPEQALQASLANLAEVMLADRPELMMAAG
jgi:5-methylcytosine-specific restriction enzyme subunit McrC